MVLEEPITSLSELLEVLPECTKDDYCEIAEEMKISRSEVEKFLTWNNDRYTRNCLVRTEKYELLILCWDVDQTTPIHCHGGQECWVYMVEGQLKEEHFAEEQGQPVFEDSSTMGEGQVSFMNDELGFHALKNESGRRAISMHLYMNPIDECSFFDEQKKEFITVSPSYDYFHGL